MRLAALISLGVILEIIFESGSLGASDDTDGDDSGEPDLRRRKEVKKPPTLSVILLFLARTRVSGRVVLFEVVVMVDVEERTGGGLMWCGRIWNFEVKRKTCQSFYIYDSNGFRIPSSRVVKT